MRVASAAQRICGVRAVNETCITAGATAAFGVLADAAMWHEAVRLGIACLVSSCRQPEQLLVGLHNHPVTGYPPQRSVCFVCMAKMRCTQQHAA